MASDPIRLEYHGSKAVITLANEKNLNALTPELYYRLGCLLREVAQRKEIYFTLLIGMGRYFSAGADISKPNADGEQEDVRRYWLSRVLSTNLDVTQAFYSHPKILITALNGPVIGLSAALIAFSDFIYATPDAWLLTPFTSLGLVAEGGASQAFVQRMGIAKANEALIMSRRITAQELLQAGFVNSIFDAGRDAEKFKALVMQEIDDKLGSHLNAESLLKTKALIRKPERESLDRQNVAEVLEGLERFAARIPQKEFARIARGEKRHKL
ncbi:MAG: hypothetical protein M1826_002680 [Phylliscum demangeonii]|nr:MAG: hypothetical protein M1826_002680 [Phylliscum demangeonii]